MAYQLTFKGQGEALLKEEIYEELRSGQQYHLPNPEIKNWTTTDSAL